VTTRRFDQLAGFGVASEHSHVDVDRRRTSMSSVVVSFSLVASWSGAVGAHRRQASITATAWLNGDATWRFVASCGAGTVANASEVTTPKLPAPAPRSAQKRSPSRCSSQVDDAPVARDDLRSDQPVGRDAVRAPEDSQTTTEGQPRDAHGWTGASRDGQAESLQCCVHLAEAGAPMVTTPPRRR
jgi:hypothetical protein